MAKKTANAKGRRKARLKAGVKTGRKRKSATRPKPAGKRAAKRAAASRSAARRVAPLAVAAPAAAAPAAAATPAAAFDPITQIAARSAIAQHVWPGRGVAPIGYIKGMALVYARVLCKLKAADAAAVEMAKADTGDGDRDVLAWYAEKFAALGMRNDIAGVDTLRHLFALLIGVGMRESSGKYCEGRDRHAHNVTAETAEAGLFQASFNARRASPLMPKLIDRYAANPSGFVEVFKEGPVRCSAASLENFGSGPGRDFQQLSKQCPAFAAEFTAVGLRNLRTQWGSINRRRAELHPDSDAMLMEVQRAVDATPGLCAAVA